MDLGPYRPLYTLAGCAGYFGCYGAHCRVYIRGAGLLLLGVTRGDTLRSRRPVHVGSDEITMRTVGDS